MTRADDKVAEIYKYLEELSGIAPSKFEEYKSSIEKKAACERYVEKIIEAVTDLAFLAIKNKKLRIPEDDIDAFNILFENNIINSYLTARLKNAKGMRNIISHQYGKVDDEIVFESITENMDKDVKEFIEKIKEVI